MRPNFKQFQDLQLGDKVYILIDNKIQSSVIKSKITSFDSLTFGLENNFTFSTKPNQYVEQWTHRVFFSNAVYAIDYCEEQEDIIKKRIDQAKFNLSCLRNSLVKLKMEDRKNSEKEKQVNRIMTK